MLTVGDIRYKIVDFNGFIEWVQAGNGVYFVDSHFVSEFLKIAA